MALQRIACNTPDEQDLRLSCRIAGVHRLDLPRPRAIRNNVIEPATCEAGSRNWIRSVSSLARAFVGAPWGSTGQHRIRLPFSLALRTLTRKMSRTTAIEAGLPFRFPLHPLPAPL